MLKILSENECFSEPCTLVLGGFDGLHLGHRALLDCAKKFQRPIGISTMIGGKGSALFTREERRFLFERAGIFFAIEFEWTSRFQNTSAEEFLKELFLRVKPEAIVCGEDFRFGKGALGTPSLLKESAPCPVYIVETVKEPIGERGRRKKISSSACKKYLERGDLLKLNACLEARGNFFDSAYFVQGTVEHGREEGRKYGFPTLNLSAPEEKLLPPDGVYGGFAATERGNFPSIVNFGPRPTFSVFEKKIEAHLLGFRGDLYGTLVRVYPTKFLRPIQKFESIEALKNQLQIDLERVCK